MIKYKMFSKIDLYEHLVNYSLENPHKKIEEVENDIKYFNFNYDHDNYFFFCAIDGDKFVGVVKLKVGGEDSCYHPGYKNWISFVSIHPEYQNQGISKILITKTFEYVKKSNINVLMSGYSVKGWYFLRPTIHKLAKLFNIDLKDDATRPDFIDWTEYEGFSEDKYNSLLANF